jgi:hypothetical protein
VKVEFVELRPKTYRAQVPDFYSRSFKESPTTKNNRGANRLGGLYPGSLIQNETHGDRFTTLDFKGASQTARKTMRERKMSDDDMEF